MRVLMISWEFPPHVVGGIGRHVAELTPALGGIETTSGSIHIDLITPNYAGGPPVEQLTPYLTVHRVETPPMDVGDFYHGVVTSNAVFIEVASRLAAEQPYDLIHIHEWQTGMAGIVLKHRWKRPLLATIHATERGRHRGHLPSHLSCQIDQMEWKICYEAWRVIVCSQYMRQELHQFFRAPLDKLEVIFNGIYPPQSCSPDELTVKRQQYAPNNEKLLFYVGRITPEKGVQVLVRAMPRLRAEHPNIRLLMAGKNSHQLWPLAYELGVENAVDFLGFISDQERDCIYQIADAAIFPSLYEPFGIVALEAMALNCNVIASDVGGLSEVVKHQENGLTILPDDPMSVVWAVNQLLCDPEAAAQRRQRALAEIHSIYQWSTIAAQTAGLYQTVLNERARVVW